MDVLLSIKPEFATAIFSGTKKYEYRRTIFKQSVRKIVVYASAPVSQVIGEFEVDGLLHDEVDQLWCDTGELGGITKEFFESYFTGKQKGYAIRVKNARRYAEPFCPRVAYGKQPPQSFVYLDA